MFNRIRGKFNADGLERLVRQALDEESLGRLPDAAKLWQEVSLAKKKPDNHPDRPWGLVADKYLQYHQDADKIYDKLKTRALEEKKLADKKGKPDDKKPADKKPDDKKDDKKAPEPPLIERLSLDAVRAELGKSAEAGEQWERVKKTADPETGQRPYYLLAAKRMRELASKK